MTDKLSPFVFKRLSLAHLGLGDITLKFRRATYVDNDYFREKYGNDDGLTKVFQDPIIVLKSLFRFLSPRILEEIKKMPIHKRDDETGDLLPASEQYSIKTKFLMLFVSNEKMNDEIYRLFLEILGHGDKDIDALMGISNAEKEEKEKKTKKPIQKKKS